MRIKDMPDMVPIPLSDDVSSWWKSIFAWLFRRRRFLIKSNWYYIIPATKTRSAIHIMIPRGFIFDGASIPRLLWFIIDPFGIMLINGLIHDFGYRYRFLLDVNGVPIYINRTRKFFDQIFEDVGKYTNGLLYVNHGAYLALRIAGKPAWNANRKLDAPIYWQQDNRTVETMWDDLMESSKFIEFIHAGCPRDVYLQNIT